MPSTCFTVARSNLRDTRFDNADAPPLQVGEVRLRITSFALTANNITYAAFGEAMRYWDFFPCSDASRGCIPVWGFGDVSASRAEGIREGERFYGYLPMANEVTLAPTRVNDAGFTDGAPHRQGLAAVYNHYTRCSSDPGYQPDQEAQIALLRPLFTTAFLIDDFLADADFFGASTVMLSSASSKTAWATAFCLAQRRALGTLPRVVGLTSSRNLDYTRGLGLYDEVLAYDEVRGLPTSGKAVYVDYSGSADLRSDVHHHFADQLSHSCAVGGTHWETLGSGSGLPGPRPTLFFAPAQIKKRIAEWGQAGFAERLAATWRAFMKPVNDPAAPWLRVVDGQGPDAIRSAYLAQLDGQVPAVEGQMLAL